jgi:hypothetical protein
MNEDINQESLSTAIADSPQPGGTGGGAPPPETGDENLSIAEVLRKEAAAQKEAEGKPKPVEDEKPVTLKEPQQKADKAEVADSGDDDGEEVGTKPPDAGEKEAAKAAQSEGKADRIPSRLLPKEREVWANVPNAVKAAWERMEREHNEASQKYEPAVKFHEELREFDQMARSANTTVKDALSRYVEFDKTLAQDFGRGMAQIIQAHGKNPVEAVAQMMRAAGVLPAQLGAYLQGQPAQQARTQQQPQATADPAAQRALREIQELKQQMASQQQEQSIRQVEVDIITPHAAKFPRFAELQEPIAKLLNSGIIPSSLSQVERLEVAQDMAERLNPSPIPTRPGFAEPAGNIASDAGKKSVRGAPSTGKSSDAEIDNVTDLRDLLRKEAKRMV